MILKEFIEKFVCKNTLVRIWEPYKNGHRLLFSDEKDVCMEWEVLKGNVYQSRFLDNDVIGVTDIVCHNNMEAVNIVIKTN